MAGRQKGDHHPSGVTGLCDELIPRPRKNTFYERKNWTDQRDEAQQQTEKELTIGHLECTIIVQTKRLLYSQPFVTLLYPIEMTYTIPRVNFNTSTAEAVAKYQFYEQLERAYAAQPAQVMTMMGNANAKL
jgi:hypothetical protein